MKILFISENYFPNFSGVPVVVQYLAESLAKRGHEVSILTKKVNDFPNFEILNGVRIYRKNVYMNKLKIYKGDIKEFIQFVIEYNADVNIFECATVVTTDICLPFLNKIKGIKLLHSHGFSRLILKPFERMSTIRNTIGNTYNYLRWKPYFYRIFPKYVNDFDGVFCLSEVDSSYDYLKSIYKKDVDILGNAADNVFFEESEKSINKYTTIKGEGYFLSVANYDAVKNQIGILKSYYKSECKQFDMVFIGGKDNYYYQALLEENKRLEKEYGPRNIHFLVGVDRKDIAGIYEYAYLYVVGSFAEGYSISIIESMAKGVPFISTNVGNARLLPGGIVVENIDNLSTAMNSFMNNPDLYAKLSIQGKEYAFNNCRIEKVSNQLLDIVKKVESHKYDLY